MFDLMAQLQSNIDAEHSLRNKLRLVSAIKHMPERAVFYAHWHDKSGPSLHETAETNSPNAIVKLFLGERAVERLEGEVQALCVRAGLLGVSGPARAAEFLFCRPNLSLYATRLCPGHTGTLSLKLDAAPPDYLIQGAAMWLAEIIRRNHSINGLAGNYWRKVLNQDAPLSASEERAASKFEKLHDKVREVAYMALPAASGPVTQSPGHGDFQLGNLIYDENTVYAIDFHAQNRRPVAQEIAYFLIRTNAFSDTQGSTLGLNDRLIAPFRTILPEGELDRLLPFFLGVELLNSFKRCEHWSERAVYRRNKMAERYVASMS
ncbi:phosphotransferase [Celeribacter naphthalenivorans]|uniref:phosphotransferase n=1 Tax=Celeribacter naphthalenivorans TaxID=1614694 RepID=UPI001CFB5E6E|nr:phosphotransferase [Celeribacter naphthalenivorans]